MVMPALVALAASTSRWFRSFASSQASGKFLQILKRVKYQKYLNICSFTCSKAPLASQAVSLLMVLVSRWVDGLPEVDEFGDMIVGNVIFICWSCPVHTTLQHPIFEMLTWNVNDHSLWDSTRAHRISCHSFLDEFFFHAPFDFSLTLNFAVIA